MNIRAAVWIVLILLSLFAGNLQAQAVRVENLNPVRLIEGNSAAKRVQFDADASQIVIEYAGGGAALYTMETGERLDQDAIMLTPADGTAGAAGTTLSLDGQPVIELPAPALTLAISSTGTRLAAALEDHTVVVYDTATGVSLAVLNAAADTLLFNPAGDVLAVNNPPLNQIILWQENGIQIVLPGQSPVQFSPDGAYIAQVNQQNTVTIRRMSDVLAREEEVILGTLTTHYSGITDMAFSPDSRLMASAGQDGSISLWDMTGLAEIAVLMGHSAGVNTLDFSPDGTLLASGDQAGELRIWDIAARQSLRALNGTGAPLLDVRFAQDTIVTAGADGRVIFWQSGEAIDLPAYEPLISSDTPLPIEQSADAKARRDLSAGYHPLHPVGCFIQKDDPVRVIGQSAEGSLLLNAAGCEGAVWTEYGAAYFNWQDLSAPENLPLTEPPDSMPLSRIPDYESVCTRVQDHRTADNHNPERQHALYPPDYVPAAAQATLATGVTTVICHNYETRPVENCHYLGPGNYSYIFTRQRLYDTIRLVDYASGTVIAQQRFTGGTPPSCPGRVTRGTATGDAPAPAVWMAWVLRNTGYDSLLPLRTRIAGTRPVPLFMQPDADTFGTLPPGTAVNVIGHSGENWMLILQADMSEAWVKAENITLAGSIERADLPETSRPARHEEAPDPDEQPEILSAFRPLGRITIPADQLVQSPDGFYVAGIQQQDSGTRLGLWDLRGGQQVWQVSLPDRQWEILRFSPGGETLMVKTTAPYPAEEEIRFTFYDALTGEVVSETGDADIIDSPLIPGNMAQSLSAEPAYTRDGKALMVDYWRRTEAPRCAVWDVQTAQLLWEIEARCGALNPEGHYMIVPRLYTDIFSSYSQLVIYEVATGAVVAASQDEVINYRWLNDQYIFIERPYGEYPVIWNIIDGKTALLELPQRISSFQPQVLNDLIYYNDGSTTFVWDIATGELVGDTVLQGTLVKQPGRVIVLQQYQPEDSDMTLMRAIDLENEAVIWEVEWQYSRLSIRDDGMSGFAYNHETDSIDIFDLMTGTVTGHIQVPYLDAILTPDWQWLIQENGYYQFTVWGTADAVSLFSDPPQLLITANTQAYYEPNTTFPYNQVVIPAGQYLWVNTRTAASDWVEVNTSYGRFWLPTTHAEFLVDTEHIPVR